MYIYIPDRNIIKDPIRYLHTVTVLELAGEQVKAKAKAAKQKRCASQCVVAMRAQWISWQEFNAFGGVCSYSENVQHLLGT